MMLHESDSLLTTKVGLKGESSKIGKATNKKLMPAPLHFIVFPPFFPLVPVLHWLSMLSFPLFTLLYLSSQKSCPGSQSCPPPLSSIAPSPPRSSSSPQAGVSRSTQRGARSLAPRPSSAEAYYIMYQSQT